MDFETAQKLILGRALHLDRDGHVVEEDDPKGETVLGGPGSAISPEDVKKYGLNESHTQQKPSFSEPVIDSFPPEILTEPKRRGRKPKEQ